MTESPAPGWYPAPHANDEQRYWDGTRWLDHPSQVSEQPGSVTVAAKPARGLALAALIVGIVAFLLGLLPVVGLLIGLAAVALGIAAIIKKQPKGLAVTGIVLGAIALITSIAMTAGLGAAINAGPRPASVISSQPSGSSEPVEEVEPAEEPAVMVTVPDVTGMTASDAYNAITQAGLTPPLITSFEDPAAKVVSTSPAANAEAEEGSEIAFTLEEKPKLTLAQENVIRQAESYLRNMGFSRAGLIDQLEYEGYSPEDSAFGADNAGADWNAEAAEKAASYLETMSFSRQGLYDQLAYEEFTPEQIEFALASVGY